MTFDNDDTKLSKRPIFTHTHTHTHRIDKDICFKRSLSSNTMVPFTKVVVFTYKVPGQ